MVKVETVIPTWLTGRLSRQDLEKIATAIRQVEVTTSGEIVPIIVRRSTFIGHVLPIIALSLCAFYFAFGGAPALEPWRTFGHPALWTALDIVLLALIAVGLSRVPAIQNRLVMPMDLDAQVHQRAELEFFNSGLNKTQDATGILLFLSFAERRAVVLADKSIAAKLSPDTWQKVLTLMIDGARERDVAGGLVRAINACGELVRPHFPIQANDRNELKDALVIKD